MKKILNAAMLICLSFAFSTSMLAQETKVVQKPANVQVSQNHRIVFQMATGDTMAHKQLMKQLGNIQNISPGTKVEVICHGAGLNLLITDKSIVADKISKFVKTGVVFNACEFSMKDQNIEKAQMLQDASYVPAAILHIASRQEQGWSYIKSGF